MGKQIDMFQQYAEEQQQERIKSMPKRGYYHELTIHQKINLKAMEPVFSLMWMREGLAATKGRVSLYSIDPQKMKKLNGLGEEWNWQIKHNHQKSFKTLQYLKQLHAAPAKQLKII